MSSFDPRHRSRILLDGPERAPARAMLKAIGFTEEDLSRPIVGIANTWVETMPCNYHLRELAQAVKEGIRAAGGTPMEFNTIAISDGVTMGTEGMKASLISREVIADSIELVGRGHFLMRWCAWWLVTRPSREGRWGFCGATFRDSCCTVARLPRDVGGIAL
ncbi:Dihydroxy-acid dehydratase [bacterium HR36]|nr:Dihydroxy-acid dehydratase [bacterium HR36]